MSSNTYARLCDEVYKRILGKLERHEEEERRFAVNGTARKVLDDDFLKRFFRSLCLSAVISMGHGHINESDLIRRLDKKNLYDFLAIMIFTTCTIEAARTFTIELLINDSWPPDMFRLPVGRKQLRELFREDITPDKFLAHQACFCPVTIVKGREYRIKTPGRERLPYLEEKLRAKGSFGAVYTVKIAKGHFYDPQTELANRHPMTVARKDYLVAGESARDQEVMKKILSADRACKNIVDYYGSVAIGLTTYSLFMPMAICDLKVYMMELHKTNPNTISDKAGFIRCAHGLAGGLNFLHNGMRSANGERLVCYHMDLKPSNILIYRDTGHGESPYIWKISDFGMSRVKVRRRGEGVDSESNFNSWFLRRPKAQEPSTSGTMNRRGEGTYLAPEAIAATPTMKTGSDVWSLGCVISVLFAYLEEGALGVDRYSDKRGDLDSADGYDRFFIRTRGWGPFKPHPVVREWHDRLIHHAKQRNRKEANAVEFMLGYLDNRVFKEQSKRCNVTALENMLWYTYIKYIDADPTSAQNPESHNPARAGVDPIKRPRWWRAFQSQKDPPPNGRVNRWLLDSHDAFKGWAISPEGSLIAFWTDSKISLYTSESLHPDDTRVKTLVPEFTLDDTGAIWKSISLTENHLIAFTSGDRPQVRMDAIVLIKDLVADYGPLLVL
jgi:serine/threonine protein kinase